MITYTMKNAAGRVKVVTRCEDMNALSMLGFWCVRMVNDEAMVTLEFDPDEVRDTPAGSQPLG